MTMFFPSWICAFGQHCFLSDPFKSHVRMFPRCRSAHVIVNVAGPYMLTQARLWRCFLDLFSAFPRCTGRTSPGLLLSLWH